jgi:hypothetical protein
MRRIAVIAALLGALLAAETKVEVKELTKTQQDALAVARARLERAQKNLEMVEDGIRKAHSAAVESRSIGDDIVRATGSGRVSTCGDLSYTKGEFIYPKWLKLTTETYSSCGYVFLPPNEVKPIP